MRDETAAWLLPMMNAADDQKITTETINSLIVAASMPAAEADTPIANWLVKMEESGELGDSRAIDWVRFGQLLRHELGWDDTYPAFPDAKALRLVPAANRCDVRNTSNVTGDVPPPDDQPEG